MDEIALENRLVEDACVPENGRPNHAARLATTVALARPDAGPTHCEVSRTQEASLMTSRDRHATAGVLSAPSQVSAELMPLTPGLVHAPLSTSDRLPDWDKLRQQLAPAQKQELLALAQQQQGLLYQHQLAQLPDSSSASTANRSWLGKLLAEESPELPSPHAQQFTCSDPELDDAQRFAVSRALNSPDLTLLSGYLGTGKSRVVAEILVQSAKLGQRALLLAPQTKLLDRVLLSLANKPEVYAIRCLSQREEPALLPPSIRALTYASRLEQAQTTLRAQADQEVQASCNRLAECQRQAELWPKLQVLVDAQAQSTAKLAALQAQQAVLAERVQAQVQSLLAGRSAVGVFEEQLHADHSQYQTESSRRAQALQLATEAQAKSTALTQSLALQLACKRPLAEKRKQGQWWNPALWLASLQGDLQALVAKLTAEHERAEQALHAADALVVQLTAEQEQAASAWQEQLRARTEHEIAQQQQSLAAQLTQLQTEQSQQTQAWETHTQALSAGGEPAPEGSSPWLAQAQERWQQQLAEQEKAHAFHVHWARCLADSFETCTEKLPEYCNVWAVPSYDAAAEPALVKAEARPFDLLIVLGAEQFTEADLAQAMRRAHRWILVGLPAQRSATHEVQPEPRNGKASNSTKVRAFRPVSVFHRLWKKLHSDPSKLPYHWRLEQDKLCCQLVPLAPEQRLYLEKERLADAPEIELRILALPGREPTLAEVLFPANTNLVQAKEFIYRELQELSVQAWGSSVCWHENPDRVVLQLGANAQPHHLSVALGSGIYEMLTEQAPQSGRVPTTASPRWQTCCLEFAKSEGWLRSQAEQWVEQKLKLRESGRTAWLEQVYQQQPELASIVADLLGQPTKPAKFVQNSSSAANQAALIFVPVPALASNRADPKRGRPQKERAADPLSLPKAGAGLELDLSEPRLRDKVPPEQRKSLPNVGYVNYLEAQALVKLVQQVLATQGKANGKPAPKLAVVAPYAAQLDLIRSLFTQQVGVSIFEQVKLGTLDEVQHEPTDILFVSLTRSHGHRAVSFTNGSASWLEQAFAWPRRQLWLLGDTGTLLKRSQHEGALEALDESTSQREREILAKLVSYLQEPALAPTHFQIREGG